MVDWTLQECCYKPVITLETTRKLRKSKASCIKEVDISILGPVIVEVEYKAGLKE